MFNWAVWTRDRIILKSTNQIITYCFWKCPIRWTRSSCLRTGPQQQWTSNGISRHVRDHWNSTACRKASNLCCKKNTHRKNPAKNGKKIFTKLLTERSPQSLCKKCCLWTRYINKMRSFWKTAKSDASAFYRKGNLFIYLISHNNDCFGFLV